MYVHNGGVTCADYWLVLQYNHLSVKHLKQQQWKFMVKLRFKIYKDNCNEHFDFNITTNGQFIALKCKPKN